MEGSHREKCSEGHARRDNRFASHLTTPDRGDDLAALPVGPARLPHDRPAQLRARRSLIGTTASPRASPLTAGGWSPSSLPQNQELLRSWTVRLNSAITSAGARTSCRNAAIEVNGMFIPAGEAWRTAWVADSTLAFQSADHLHRSRLGTYLAALVHFELLYDRPATELPPTCPTSRWTTLDASRRSHPERGRVSPCEARAPRSTSSASHA